MVTADDDLIPHLPLSRNLNRLPPGKKEHFWRHPEVEGFALRVRRKAGTAILNTWTHQRRKSGRKSLGDATVVKLEDAIKAAKKINAKVELGTDVKAEREEQRAANSMSLKQLLIDHCDYKAKKIRPSSLAQKRHYLLGRDEPGKCRNHRSRGMIKSYLAPWHNKPVAMFTKTHASEAIAKCEANSGKPSAVALRSHLSAALSWGVGEGRYHLKENVVTYARQIEEEEGKVTGRVFTDAELKLLWDHAPEGDARAVIRMLILTACRRSEVGNMAWSEITAERWSIPLERLKNRRTRIKVDAGAHALKADSLYSRRVLRPLTLSRPRRVGSVTRMSPSAAPSFKLNSGGTNVGGSRWFTGVIHGSAEVDRGVEAGRAPR